LAALTPATDAVADSGDEVEIDEEVERLNAMPAAVGTAMA
jgi:hypothetical protein